MRSPDLSPPPRPPVEVAADPPAGREVIGAAHFGLVAPEVRAAFRHLYAALGLPRPAGAPTFRRLVLDAWDLADALYARCPGGVGYGAFLERRRKLAASALAWVEAVLLAETAVELAERLPILRGRPGEQG